MRFLYIHDSEVLFLLTTFFPSLEGTTLIDPPLNRLSMATELCHCESATANAATSE